MLSSDPPRLTTTHGRRALAALTAVALLLGARGEGTPSLDQTVAHAQGLSATAVERCDAVRSSSTGVRRPSSPLRALVKVRNDRVAECALRHWPGCTTEGRRGPGGPARRPQPGCGPQRHDGAGTDR